MIYPHNADAGSFETVCIRPFHLTGHIFVHSFFLNSVVALSSDADLPYMATKNTTHSAFWF
jgi:hypothetical protein